MPRIFFVFSRGFLHALLFTGVLSLVSATAAPKPDAPETPKSKGPISGQDVNGKSVAVNGSGHYTVVLYTNPDLEDASRAMTMALDSYRSRLTLVRVVDLRGGVPPEMRGIVKVQIRKEQAKEDLRLKKAGVDGAEGPIIPDFNGSTLEALGWDNIYDHVHLVVYDRSGHEVKRLESVSDAKQLTKAVDSIL